MKKSHLYAKKKEFKQVYDAFVDEEDLIWGEIPFDFESDPEGTIEKIVSKDSTQW